MLHPWFLSKRVRWLVEPLELTSLEDLTTTQVCDPLEMIRF